MKREKAFSKGGAYAFVLSSNLLLHKQVGDAGIGLLSPWLQDFSAQKVIRVLDLACGGAPVSICRMMQAFPHKTFDYIGIDINPDQVELAARSFEFPRNVRTVDVIEGNAWDFRQLVSGEFDIIFTGMNLHHGVPEELYCLLLQAREKLAEGGLFINHDCYRPGEFHYLRRPQFNPKNRQESFAMVSEESLKACETAGFDFPEAAEGFDWRESFLVGYIEAMRGRGSDEEGVTEVCEHIRNRDYPVSLAEMEQIAARAGLDVKSVDLRAQDEPLNDYMKLLAFSKS